MQKFEYCSFLCTFFKKRDTIQGGHYSRKYGMQLASHSHAHSRGKKVLNNPEPCYALCKIHRWDSFTQSKNESCKPQENTNKMHQNAIGKKLKSKSLLSFVSFFHAICKISNFYMWSAKHLAQASCTELTLNFHSIVNFLRNIT